MRKKIQVIIGLIIGIVLVWWLFKDTEWPKVFAALHRANWGWLFVSLLLVLLTFAARAWRWHFIVRTDRFVPYIRLFNATQIGFLGNFVLPARIGEVIRAVVLSRSTGIPVTKSLAFVALDRVTDLIGLMAILLLTIFTFNPEAPISLPKDLQNLYSGEISALMVHHAAEMIGFGLLLLIVAMLVVWLARDMVIRLCEQIVGLFSRRLAQALAGMIRHFTDGMAALGSPRDFGCAVAVSLAMWGFFALTYWTLLLGMHIEVSWYAPFVLLSLLAVFISIPGPPGFVGPFHAGIVGGLLLVDPGIDLDLARATAILGHLMNLVPVVAVGVWCLSTEKVSLSELKRESEQAQKTVSES